MENIKVLNWTGLILLGVTSRIVPHPANFTVMGGMAVWLGSKNNKREIFLPIISMFLADLILGFDSWYMRLIVYGSTGLMYIAGQVFKKNLWVGSMVGSLIFFGITNLGVWWTSTLYSKTTWGLVQCFYMALPFWRNALMADVFFSQVLKQAETWVGRNSAAGYTISNGS